MVGIAEENLPGCEGMTGLDVIGQENWRSKNNYDTAIVMTVLMQETIWLYQSSLVIVVSSSPFTLKCLSQIWLHECCFS